jgi:hypothetical protein
MEWDWIWGWEDVKKGIGNLFIRVRFEDFTSTERGRRCKSFGYEDIFVFLWDDIRFRDRQSLDINQYVKDGSLQNGGSGNPGPFEFK